MDSMNSVSITGGGYTAQISLVGGQLLSLTHQEDDLVVPAAKAEGAFAGAVLAPWPNRTKGGSYTYAGVEHMLPVNEETTGAALHGLLIDLPLRVVSQKETEVQLRGWLESSEGYPFGLDIALTYRVSSDVGLAATLMARYRPEELEDEASAAAQTELDSEPASVEAETQDEDAASESGEDVASESGEDVAGEAASDSEAVSDGEAAAEPVLAETEAAEAAETSATESSPVEGREIEADEDAEDADHAEAAEGEPAEAASAPAPQTAPFGAGFHPYLSVGGAPLTECRLRLPAKTMLKTKADGTVTARKPVSRDFDFTNGPLLAGRTIDHAFTDLPEEGWTAELVHGPTGFVVRMIADSPWVQIYTGDRIDRAGVAVEPMTCPPNALNSGEDLIHLVPGEWFRMGYSIEAIRAD